MNVIQSLCFVQRPIEAIEFVLDCSPTEIQTQNLNFCLFSGRLFMVGYIDRIQPSPDNIPYCDHINHCTL